MNANNKNEYKYNQSAKKMQDALILLLDGKEFTHITVKEICEKAGVNRSTFYLHYNNVNELLTETMEATYQDFFHRYGNLNLEKMKIDERTEDELFFIQSKYLVPYLTFVRDNRKLFCLMYDKHDLMGAEKMYSNWFREIFRPILTRFGVSDTEQPFIMIFFLKGLLGVVTEWIQTDCELPIEEMIAIIRKCIIKP